MRTIQIPDVFNLKLRNTGYEAPLKDAINKTTGLYAENRMYFFPEYTDHGIEHIEAVLNSSANLIHSDSISLILKEKDISVLCASILIHDIGMHLSFDGFQSIISGVFDNIRDVSLDKNTWSELWRAFIGEFKRFSGKQLINLFGTMDVRIQFPITNCQTEQERLLIGEFLRRHHPRLALEIAIAGLPGKESVAIPILEGFNSQERKIIGIIARSHGMELRDTTRYISNIVGSRAHKFPLGIHAYFHMVVLRIADYIQISKSRIDTYSRNFRKYSSPISELERDKHFTIELVQDMYNDDKESLHVIAFPENSATYIGINNLVRSIQGEFDKCWAFIGEVYGSFNEDECPKIKFRRITTNIHEDEFISTINYIPKAFRFTANEELGKLLIGPLYGSDPKFGIRELLQNAIDACEERLSNSLNLGETYVGNVVIHIFREKDNYYFEITDNGKGMSEVEIESYFLRLGASIRHSQQWKQTYIDESGKVKLRKAGRFGIGVLAGFLIGKQMEVTTRTTNENRGALHFVANLTNDSIEVKLDKNCHDIGTRIRIQIDKKLYHFFQREASIKDYFDWYKLAVPTVIVLFDGLLAYKRSNFFPNSSAEKYEGWQKLSFTDFDAVFWRYEQVTQGSLNCNGIHVSSSYPFKDSNLTRPDLIIFDNDSKLQLTLDRSKIDGDLPFENLLFRDILEHFCYELLTKDLFSSQSDIFYPWHLSASGNNNEKIISQGYTILKLNNGFILNQEYFLSKISRPELNFKKLYISSEGLVLKPNEIPNGFVYSAEKRPPLSSTVLYGRLAIENKLKYFDEESNIWFPDKQDDDRTQAVSTEVAALFFKYRWQITDIRVTKIYDTMRKNEFNETLEACFGDYPVIPYNVHERQEKFKESFLKLSEKFKS